jgi:TPR repeat protein
MSEAQLTQLVKGSVPSERIVRLVSSCGIDFEPTPVAIDRLSSVGIPEAIVDAVRAAKGPTARKHQTEQAIWDSIKDSRDPAVFEDYLRQNPEGQFADAARLAYKKLKLAAVRAEMERNLATGQWDAAEAKIRELLRDVPEDDEIRGWEQRLATWREAQRKLDRIAALRTAIPSYVQAKQWASADQSIAELLSLVPGDAQAAYWQRRVSDGREEDRRVTQRVAALRTAIPSYLQAGQWASAEQGVTELLSLAPGDSQAQEWQSQAAAGRLAETRRTALSVTPKRTAQQLDDIAKRADASYARRDYATSARLYQEMAGNGRADAMIRLGYMYQFALGFAQSDSQAYFWYRWAADQGYALGMTNVGWMYANGRGVALDYVQAVAWYRKAAEKGEPTGMNDLGWMYEQGRGVGKDIAEATAWYRKAAALGNAQASANLKRLGQ